MCLVAEKMREKKKKKKELEFHLKKLRLSREAITTIGIIELNYIQK
jgi:hypothetical protein